MTGQENGPGAGGGGGVSPQTSCNEAILANGPRAQTQVSTTYAHVTRWCRVVQGAFMSLGEKPAGADYLLWSTY